MALLPPRNVRVAPLSMPQSGGTVTLTFEADTTGGATRLKATYTVPAPQPYVFENATGADPRVIEGGPQAVTGVPADFPQELKLKKSIAGPSGLINVRVSVSVVEVDGNGKTVPPPFRLTGRVRLVP